MHTDLKPTTEDILKEISEIFEEPVEKIASPTQKADICKLRHLYCFVAYTLLKKSISQKKIGEIIGGKDHTTVAWGYKHIKMYIENEDEYIMKEWDKYQQNSKIWKSFIESTHKLCKAS